MMTAVWFFQIGFDVACLSALLFVLFKRATGAVSTEKLDAALAVVESRVKQWEKEMVEFRERRDKELLALREIAEKAASLIPRAMAAGNLSTKEDELFISESVEAKELRSALDRKDEIPTLRQIEKTKQRLHSEIQMNLRTLLNEQLS